MSHDEVTEMVVGHEGGIVFIQFKKPMQRIEFDPENIVQVALALTDHAFEAQTSLKPVGDSLKAELIERHRMNLTQRLAVMLGSLREDRTVSNGRLSQTMVDTMLRDVFT